MISFNILSLCFKFFPRNRIVSNTFKYRRNSSTTISKSNTSGIFNNLNPVMEETERESMNKFKKKESIEEVVYNTDNEFKNDPPCFSTPSKRHLFLILFNVNKKF